MAASSIFDGIDMSDPCAVAPKMEEALNRLLAGEMTVEARFGTDAVVWQQSDAKLLEARVRQLKTECQARQNPCRPAIPVIYPRYRSGW